MTRRRGLLLVLTLLPTLTMLGSAVLMNSGSRNWEPIGAMLLYFGFILQIVLAFFVGYLPSSGRSAARVGGVYFFLFALFYLLQFGRLYSDLFSMPYDAGVVQWIVITLMGIVISLALFLTGVFVSRRTKRKNAEVRDENTEIRKI